jgi:DNA-binding NarL/FixJ family response regulator
VTTPSFGLDRTKGDPPGADTSTVDAAQRNEILTRYREHTARFDSVAARRDPAVAEVIPFQPPAQETGQEPTAREIEVLQLISDGLVNREIGVRLFLSEETVKSHVRHLLAKLQARSRAHAVAVGFRRGLID